MDEPLTVRTLTDGGQTAESVAADLVAFLGEARTSLDIALYDVRLPGAVGDAVAGALRAARDRGVAVRIAYDSGDDGRPRPPMPPPPRTRPEILDAVGVPTRPIPGEPDLMHHKYVVRDAAALWTGSTNWTLDSWTREENVLMTVASPEVAAAYAANFRELWDGGRVEGTGEHDGTPAPVGGATVRPWFCPGRGEALAARIAEAVDGARRRVRIASPVLTALPILEALDRRGTAADVDIAGVCDATQIHQVFGQWAANPQAAFKGPLLRRVLGSARFTGKRSTPYAPGAVHDYMHAKVTVVDDTVFCGSFNLSRSGQENAENVLEVHSAAVADRLAAFVDDARRRYPDPPR